MDDRDAFHIGDFVSWLPEWQENGIPRTVGRVLSTWEETVEVFWVRESGWTTRETVECCDLIRITPTADEEARWLRHELSK